MNEHKWSVQIQEVHWSNLLHLFYIQMLITSDSSDFCSWCFCWVVEVFHGFLFNAWRFINHCGNGLHRIPTAWLRSSLGYHWTLMKNEIITLPKLFKRKFKTPTLPQCQHKIYKSIIYCHFVGSARLKNDIKLVTLFLQSLCDPPSPPWSSNSKLCICLVMEVLMSHAQNNR